MNFIEINVQRNTSKQYFTFEPHSPETENELWHQYTNKLYKRILYFYNIDIFMRMR